MALLCVWVGRGGGGGGGGGKEENLAVLVKKAEEIRDVFTCGTHCTRQN